MTCLSCLRGVCGRRPDIGKSQARRKRPKVISHRNKEEYQRAISDYDEIKDRIKQIPQPRPVHPPPTQNPPASSLESPDAPGRRRVSESPRYSPLGH